MAREIGKVQQTVLTVLSNVPRQDIQQIARWMYGKSGKPPTRSEIETVRQAVAALIKRKLIKSDTKIVSPKGKPVWILNSNLRVQTRRSVERARKYAAKKRRLSVVSPNDP